MLNPIAFANSLAIVSGAVYLALYASVDTQNRP